VERDQSFDGGLPLEETSKNVADFEQIGWVLDRWESANGKNIFHFRLHSAGLSPNPCKFVLKGSDPGEKFVRIDSGRLLVLGEPEDVVLYRLR
jgi:hypothetical protein